MTTLRLFLLLPALATCLTGFTCLAGPGAHGPNGEHLEGHTHETTMGHAQPRFESKSELFELVANLEDDELSILIDAFETNDPVLNAKVEVACDELKAQARFHADHGDYAVDDALMLKRLLQPGVHALIVTVLAGEQSDLLEGTLQTPAVVEPVHPHIIPGPLGMSLGGSLAALAALAALAGLAGRGWLWQRGPSSSHKTTNGDTL